MLFDPPTQNSTWKVTVANWPIHWNILPEVAIEHMWILSLTKNDSTNWKLNGSYIMVNSMMCLLLKWWTEYMNHNLPYIAYYSRLKNFTFFCGLLKHFGKFLHLNTMKAHKAGNCESLLGMKVKTWNKETFSPWIISMQYYGIYQWICNLQVM